MISERTILWYMTFLGFAINFMLRMNLNIAIVSMVRHTTNVDTDKSKIELYENHISLNTSLLTNTNINYVSIIFDLLMKIIYDNAPLLLTSNL